MQRPSNKQIGWGIVAVAAILATLFFGVNYPVPPAPAEPEPGLGALDGVISLGEETRGFRPVQIRALNVAQDLGVGGDVTITGGLEVTGGVTGTNVLTTGDQTIGGTKTFTETGTFSGAVTVGGGYGSTGCTLSTAGVLQCNGAATTDGALTAASAVVGGGYGSTGCTLSAAGVLQCNGAANIDGALYSVSPVLTKDADYTVAVADTGAIIKNTAVVSATFTLPAAAAGLNYCVFNYAGSDVIIEFADDADVALNEVNSAGDSVTNTTAYDSICLTAIDAVNWMTVSSVGTWADGN